MQLQIIKNKEEIKNIDLVAYLVREDEADIFKVWHSIWPEQEALVRHRIKKEKFSGKTGQLFVINHDKKVIVLIGVGKNKKFSAETWRLACGALVKFLQTYQVDNLMVLATNWLRGQKDFVLFGQALAEGLKLASYSFDRYKKKDKNQIKVEIKNIFVVAETIIKKSIVKGWEQGLLLAQATILARDLVNEPAETMTPTHLANVALEIAKNNKRIKVKIYDEARVKKMGMNAYAAIDKGSREPLKFIHLTYLPKKKSKNKIALVGKGITFDSGGLNLKPEMSMLDMKIDMSGAAAVLGVFSVLEKLNIELEVQGFIAACENMISGSAIRPGDVIRSLSGKTIEIANTDAEGRVTLADALTYAQKQGFKKVIDLATLTGAVMVALGENYCGLFANDDKLANEISESAEQSGEKIWRLPLPEEYKKLNNSKIADVRNIPSTRYGGAITAALFLQEFIEPDVAWAHLDIAGPAYSDKPLNAYTPAGGVGYGVRTLLNLLRD